MQNLKRLAGPLSERALIVIVCAALGLLWSRIPGGENWWAFTFLLTIFVGYVFLFYDDKPKGNIRADLPLLIVTFALVLFVLIIAAVLALLIRAGISWLSRADLFDGLPNLTLLIWPILSLVAYRIFREPTGSDVPYHDDMP